MNKFNEREKSFEKKFQVDEELKFKVQARSNKYLAEFACLKLGKKEEEKINYTQEIIKADMEEAGQDKEITFLTFFSIHASITFCVPRILVFTASKGLYSAAGTCLRAAACIT